MAAAKGANKGIGLEIVKQLASNGIKVVLTARDEKRGLAAIEKLIEFAVSHHVIFHQLDVADPASIASVADFVKTQFGKLDILVEVGPIGTAELMIRWPTNIETSFIQSANWVNNAGVCGAFFNFDALRSSDGGDPKKAATETYELAEEYLQINYYGAKRTTEALLPLLHLSDSPRIVNISSSMGKLESISNERAKGIFGDAENLTEEKVDQVLKGFLKDFKEGSIESKGWPSFLAAYVVSKAALNCYTRILAKRYPTLCINAVCPGFVKTDINGNTGILSVEGGAASPVRLALLPDGAPSGLFYVRTEVSSF